MTREEAIEIFCAQMPGLAVFKEFLDRHFELIEAQKELRDKWNTMSPARVQALRAIIQQVLDAPTGVSAAVKTRIQDALTQAGIP